MSGGKTPQIFNRKLSHAYFIGKKIEAGIMLRGTEVKSLRNGEAQISNAFVRIEKGEAFLFNSHIKAYEFGNVSNHDPFRSRKLLLHRKEIDNVRAALERKGESVLPVRIYFKRGLAKVEIAFCKSKKLHDKRQQLKKKTLEREKEQAIKRYS